jgi:putative cell wall-binding protein
VLQPGGDRARLSLDEAMASDGSVGGALELTDGSPMEDLAVQVERIDLHGATALGTAVTGPDGRFSIQDPAAHDGAATYRARWSGDPAHPDGAIAILPAAGGAVVPVPASTTALTDRSIRMRDVNVQEMIADEAHERLLVLSWDWGPANAPVRTHLDVFGLDGEALGEVAPASPPRSMVLTPDRAHLLLAEPLAHQVEVLDASTLDRVALLPTGPLLHEPTSLAVVGNDLWVSGRDGRLRLSLLAPTEARLQRYQPFGNEGLVLADRAHPGFGFTMFSGYDPVLRRMDMRPEVAVLAAASQAPWWSRPPVLGSTADVPVRERTATGLIDHDPLTLAPGLVRTDPAVFEGEQVVDAAAGPQADEVIALEADTLPHSAVIWIGPIQPEVRGHLVVWRAATLPARRIPLWDLPLAFTATESGSAAFVASAGYRSLGDTGSPAEVRRWIRIIPTPFAHGPVPDVPAPDAPPPPTAPSTTTTTTAPTTTTTAPSQDVAAVRLAGAARIATAIAASQDQWATAGGGGARATAGSVVLARSDVFADALAGTPLAAAVDGPILLSASAALDGRTLAEIQRILPVGGTVHLLGGPSALGEPVAGALQAAGYAVVRHAGADRYATAVAVAEALDPTQVLLVTGTNFPDGLAAGAAAAHVGGAVLLTAGTTMPSATAAYLAAHPGLIVTAVGGPAAQARPAAPSIVGADRYATAVQVAQTFFGGTVPVVGLATGESFADALAGGAHVAVAGGPLLLTPSTVLPASVLGFLAARNPARVVVYGGPLAVAGSVLDAL